jgi:hypothetical protein
MPKTPLAALLTLLLASCGPLVGAGVAMGADEVAEEDDGGMDCFEGGARHLYARKRQSSTDPKRVNRRAGFTPPHAPRKAG